jgi:hypothetical protein
MSRPATALRIAARVRAALAYVALTYDDAAASIPEISAATLRRIASPTRPRGASDYELALIAHACSVSRDWFTRGVWSDEGELLPPAIPELGEGTQAQRLAVVEHYVEQLLLIATRDGSQVVPPSPVPRAGKRTLRLPESTP